jgi:N-acetyl-anhydromuramyl-L-alanine amidase AmpD
MEPKANVWPIDLESIPEHLYGFEWLPARYAEDSGLFLKPPVLIVLHSGSRSPRVAEYMATVPGGRKVSAHFSWHGGMKKYVQQVSLLREAWHAGGSSWTGQRANSLSIGVEMSGPYHQDPRDPPELLRLRTLLANLKLACPTLRWLVRHQSIAKKRDPGPGVSLELFQGLGYEVVWSRSEAKRLAKHDAS